MSKPIQTSDFSQGSVLSRILQIAAPMSLALLINVLYNVVDRMFIGHIPDTGDLALTGIGLAFPITVMISAFQSLCSSGGSPLFSIARGRGDRAEAEKVLGNSYMLLIVLGVLLMIVGYCVKTPVLYLTGANDETFSYANEYLSIYLMGTLFVMTSLGMNPFINAQGASKTGMITVLIGAIVNIILDPVFIYGFHMGVRGAALASVIAQGCSCIWTHAYFLGKRTEYRLKLRKMLPDVRLIGNILSLGTTGFIAQVTNSAVTMVYNAELSRMGGTIWVTVMTVLSSVREILHIPLQGFINGVQPVLSYNYGAKQYERVRSGIKIMTAIGFGYQCIVFLLTMLCPQIFIKLFNNDSAVLEYGATGMRLFFLLCPFMALQGSGQTTFIGLGHTKQAVFFSLFRKVILVIPLALLLPRIASLGVYGVFLSEPVSDIVGGGICYLTMWFTVYRKELCSNRIDSK